MPVALVFPKSSCCRLLRLAAYPKPCSFIAATFSGLTIPGRTPSPSPTGQRAAFGETSVTADTILADTRAPLSNCSMPPGALSTPQSGISDRSLRRASAAMTIGLRYESGIGFAGVTGDPDRRQLVGPVEVDRALGSTGGPSTTCWKAIAST